MSLDIVTATIQVGSIIANKSYIQPAAQGGPRRVLTYHRSIGSYSDDAVHDRVNIGDHRARQLQAPIYHFTHISVSHAVQKALSYAEFRADTSGKKSAAVLKVRLLYEFPLVFAKTYFGRRHFTGGWQGYYYALCNAFMRTTRLALMLERR